MLMEVVFTTDILKEILSPLEVGIYYILLACTYTCCHPLVAYW